MCKKKKPGENQEIVDGWDTKYVDFGEDTCSNTDPKKKIVAWKSCYLLSHQSVMQKFIETDVAKELAEDLAMQDLSDRFRNVASPST